MTKTRTIFRLVFIVLAIILLVNMTRKPNDNSESIPQFKFKMFQKIRTDSLDTRQKVNVLVNETTKFVEGSSKTRKGIHLLALLFAVLIVNEFAFLILKTIRVDNTIKNG
jgi:hypothetical protein